MSMPSSSSAASGAQGSGSTGTGGSSGVSSPAVAPAAGASGVAPAGEGGAGRGGDSWSPTHRESYIASKGLKSPSLGEYAAMKKLNLANPEHVAQAYDGHRALERDIGHFQGLGKPYTHEATGRSWAPQSQADMDGLYNEVWTAAQNGTPVQTAIENAHLRRLLAQPGGSSRAQEPLPPGQQGPAQPQVVGAPPAGAGASRPAPGAAPVVNGRGEKMVKVGEKMYPEMDPIGWGAVNGGWGEAEMAQLKAAGLA